MLGLRYQIKARRLVAPYLEPNIVGLHGLDADPFDLLVVVLIAGDYSVKRAAIIPIEIVRQRATRTGLYAGTGVLGMDGVVDVTERFRKASEA